MIGKKLIYLLSALLLVCGNVACSQRSSIDSEAMHRWPVEELMGGVETYMYPDEQLQLFSWIREGTERTRDQAVAWLRKSLEGSDDSIQEVVTREGSKPGEQRKKLMRIRDEALERALLWKLTREQDQALRAKEILRAFAQTVPEWPLYNNSGSEQYSQKEDQYFRTWNANALFGRWYPLDLGQSIPLLRAYDILRSELSKEDREFIEQGLFLHQKKLIDKFNGIMYLYHNTAGYHLMPLIRFGKVLDRPEFVHEAVRYLHEQLRYSYATDGMFREVTPDYHIQISARLERGIPEMLEGYSDPKEYRDPVSGLRFDDLYLKEKYAPFYERMKRGLSVLTLPDGTYLNINDSWPKRISVPAGMPLNEPGLLGVSGLAKLATQEMTTFLKFGGIRGHDHLDALSLVWYAGGREVISDTGYRSRNGTFERAWSTSTASHSTVAVDEELHFQNREQVAVPDRESMFTAHPPRVAGLHMLEASLPAAARFNNQGRLLVWDAEDTRVQAMEAEQPAVYPGKTRRFQRTLVMIPVDDQGNGYLVDIFRVKGGRIHDYFLKGGLDHSFSMEVSLPLEPRKGTLYEYIQLKGEAVVSSEASVVSVYPDGQQVRSRLLTHPGEVDGKVTLIQGEAPAIRREGEVPFVIMRHRVGEDEEQELESCFVWIHETGPQSVAIQEIDVQRSGTEVIIAVRRPEAIDLVFSGIDGESMFEYDGWEFKGKLAFAQRTEKDLYGRVFSGEDMIRGDFRIQSKQPLRGVVIETTMREHGDLKDSVVLEADDIDLSRSYRLLHIDFNENVRFSIPVVGVTQEEEGVRVELLHSPGFRRLPDAGVMTSFPGWRVEGVPQAVLE